MKELILRTLTGILLIILVAGSILLGPFPFLLILILIYGLGTKELLLVYLHGNRGPRFLMVLAAGIVLPLTFMVLQFDCSPLWYILPVAVWMLAYIWSNFIGGGQLILLWLAIPLTSFYLLGWMSQTQIYNPLLPLSVIVLVWINDTFAYVLGSLIGKHKIIPRLSPKKTWEGFFGGLFFSLLGALAIFAISDQYTLGSWIVISTATSIFGLMGDLYESSLKRKMKVKNMGELLPGHGGILDRFDSLFFIAPAVFLIICLIKFFR